MKAVVGEEALSVEDRMYLEFTENFESQFVKQGMYENRTVFETLDKAWELLRTFPKDALNKIPTKIINKYYQRQMDDDNETKS